MKNQNPSGRPEQPLSHRCTQDSTLGEQGIVCNGNNGETTREPALGMQRYDLAWPVVTCQQAAAAKLIPLGNELKTLILSTSKGYVALNIPGDSTADLRAVKIALSVAQASLASPSELMTLRLSPGAICVIRDPVWKMPILISKRILDFSFVSTNDGTLCGYYMFHPTILLGASKIMVGSFERNTSLSKAVGAP